MSAFLVEDKTINTVITFLTNQDTSCYRRELEKLGFDITTSIGKAELGNAMFELNVRALNQRYGSAEGFRPLDYKYIDQPFYSPESALKALACWLYQCSEGNCSKKHLFKTFQKFKGDIAYNIVSSSKAYQELSWR